MILDAKKSIFCYFFNHSRFQKVEYLLNLCLDLANFSYLDFVHKHTRTRRKRVHARKKHAHTQKQLMHARLCTYLYENFFASQLVSYELKSKISKRSDGYIRHQILLVLLVCVCMCVI